MIIPAIISDGLAVIVSILGFAALAYQVVAMLAALFYRVEATLVRARASIRKAPLRLCLEARERAGHSGLKAPYYATRNRIIRNLRSYSVFLASTTRRCLQFEV